MTRDMTPPADRSAKTAIMAMPMMPPTISNKSPHRVAVRKALAPVTAKASVPNFFLAARRRGGPPPRPASVIVQNGQGRAAS